MDFAEVLITNRITKKETTMEVTITRENFESLKGGQKPLVVDFWATWCGPCRLVGPIISEMAEKYADSLVVGKCDVEECEDLAADFGIRNIPTVLFFKNGEVVDKLVGAVSKQVFEEKFAALAQ
jgi:thioredoxin 1